MNVVNTRISQRYDTLQNWTQRNPTLLEGELAVVATDNQTRFKIGDGQHTFNELNFIDQLKLTTVSAFANILSVNNAAIGFQNSVGTHSLAAGTDTSANGQHAIALGYKAAASSNGAFVFNGDQSYLAQPYYDHGAGTFNVNAPLSNVYIEDSNIKTALSDEGFVLSTAIPTDLSDLTNSPGYTTNVGTITGITMNGASKGTSGNVNLGTVLTAHQSLTNYYQKTQTSSNVEIAAAVEQAKKTYFDDRISDIAGYDELSVVKLSANEYEELVATSATLSNTLYVVEDDFINAYGQQIKNLSPGTELSDAVNLEQLSNALTGVQIPTDLSAFTNSPGYLASNDISDYYKKSETSSSSQISNELKKYQLSGNYLSANALANYYTKSETSSASEIQTALENAGGSGSNVQVSADYQTGTRIATVSVDDVPTEIYVPSANSSSRYALVTAQLVSDNGLLTCAVNDQTITTIQVSSSSTPIVVQLPAQPADGARDFILRIEISSSTAPTFTFNGASETIDFDSEDDDWAVLEPGLNLVSFTETKRPSGNSGGSGN